MTPPHRAPRPDRAAINQVRYYALDLKNFHERSHAAPIVPILIATEAQTGPTPTLELADDRVCQPLRVHPPALRTALESAIAQLAGDSLDATRWSAAPYRPTPTIIEAACALYARHGVEAIARHDAGAVNLRVTSARVEELVEEARRERRKLICSVTGVPGAGPFSFTRAQWFAP